MTGTAPGCHGDSDVAPEVTLRGRAGSAGGGGAMAEPEPEAAGSGGGDSPEAGSGSGTGTGTGGSTGGWRRPHGPLQRYYGPSAAEAAEADPEPDPTDINGPHFDPEAFLTKIRSECPLAQLLAREAELGREIRALDSDMQTLLYENYNKFISATDTIRKMKVDFRHMEAEMDDLAANMAAISTSSARVSAALQDRHRRGAQLAGTGGGGGQDWACGGRSWRGPRGANLT
ncbi:vacuolar protein sorting-associated protein 51 homolog, partial [Neopsephotus bourkii]|uniref:vacuolar protein sorting-associated protein 51 homolog n=1 Tax=Neopsephotus bourkii TaxID=309878 RepID=UPI002AA53EE7